MMLHRMQDRGEPVVVTLKMGARTLPDAPSRNVVAELVGREKPDEVVVLGGHIDSWDVGQGAMDDGGGSVAAWEAVRLMKRLGLRPRRTVRVVLWTNEENGGRRRPAPIATRTRPSWTKHVLAMESDNGVFKPEGLRPRRLRFRGRRGAAGGRPAPRVRSARPASSGWPRARGRHRAAGARRACPAIGARRGRISRYFWYHHSRGRHAGQARSGGAGALRGGDGGDGVRRRRSAGGAAAGPEPIARGSLRTPLRAPETAPGHRSVGPRYSIRDCLHAACRCSLLLGSTPILPPIYNGRAGQLDVRPPRLEAELEVDGSSTRRPGARRPMLTGFSQFTPVGRRARGGLDRGAGLVLRPPRSTSASGPSRPTARCTPRSPTATRSARTTTSRSCSAPSTTGARRRSSR